MFSDLFIECLTRDKKLEILRNFFNEPDMSESLISRVETINTINLSFFKEFMKDEYPKEFAQIKSLTNSRTETKPSQNA